MVRNEKGLFDEARLEQQGLAMMLLDQVARSLAEGHTGSSVPALPPHLLHVPGEAQPIATLTLVQHWHTMADRCVPSDTEPDAWWDQCGPLCIQSLQTLQQWCLALLPHEDHYQHVLKPLLSDAYLVALLQMLQTVRRVIAVLYG